METRHDALNRAVVNAAIRWHVSRQPLTGEYDRSAWAEGQRAQMRADYETRLTEAVAALVADIESPAVSA